MQPCLSSLLPLKTCVQETRNEKKDPIGIYLHWPFCLSRCPYCDFNTYVRSEGIDQTRFVRALSMELSYFAQWTREQCVGSIFFGGGTPSLMEEDSVVQLLDTIARLWPLDKEVEITLEANPSTVENERLKAYARAGINRISLGIQALNDADLRSLGRRHDVATALAALAQAQTLFERVSFDLITARPGQTVAQWEEELAFALSLGTEHLSLYHLTIEPGTPFERLHSAGKLILPDEETAADFYTCTQRLCAEAGLPAYEVSNHARKGAESRHNLLYWRGGSYVGAGPGAHGRLFYPEVETGRLCRHATEILSHPDNWCRQVETQGHGLASCTPLSPALQAEEFLLMGLRLSEGISCQRYVEIVGHPLEETRLMPLIKEGFLERLTGERLRATERGILVLNRVLLELIGAS